MTNASRFIGFVAGILSFVLWISLNFFNLYSTQTSGDTVLTTFVMLALPALLACFAALKNKKMMMLVTFIWSLPISFYLLLTPGIYWLFGVTSIAYFASYLFMQGIHN
ncbi:hypothetical protein ABE096_12985 [Robertmurraya massiliosenegalensis]|uniref:hypothetical protein n=1 Tax=Robertmurraya TaxID=2837507 RepID=UPI0039A6B305